RPSGACAHGALLLEPRVGCALLTRSRHLFFNDPAPTEISTLSLHDALPISCPAARSRLPFVALGGFGIIPPWVFAARSEEHTSELQSLAYLVCRRLLSQ